LFKPKLRPGLVACCFAWSVAA